MKRLIALIAAISILAAAPTIAAPKTIGLKQLVKVAVTPAAEGLVISGNSLITYSNQSAATSDISVNAMSTTGAPLWQKVIDSSGEDVATAIAVDSTGAIWIAGTTSTPAAMESTTTITGVENPDGVAVEPKAPARLALNRVAIWKIAQTGELLSTFSTEVSATPLINAISVNSTGVSLVGEISEKPFALSMSSSGTFSKVTFIGSSKTTLTSVVRQSDGSVSAFGSSSETLLGKKLVGIRDGVLIKISKTGVVTSVVRSSAPKASRIWLSADAALLLSGTVETGKVIESALTKFAPTFNPTWTTRVPSLGQSTAITAGTTSYLAISSQSVITGVNGWKPTQPSVILLGFTDKGAMSGAWALNQLASPISMTYSKQYGLYGLALGSDQTVSIFHLN